MSRFIDGYIDRQAKNISAEQLSLFKERTTAFHIFMATMYGKTWTNANNSDESFRLWGMKLIQLNEKEIYRGMDNLEENHAQYPPNVFQFIKLCKRGKEGIEEYGLPRFKDMKPLGSE
jgi:hypothetical protein